MTKLSSIEHNADYFKKIILKFKTFIYNCYRKMIHNFCIYGVNMPPRGNFFFNIDIFRIIQWNIIIRILIIPQDMQN